MNGGRCSTTRIWRPPSSTASWSADGSFASMDPRDELVISSWRTPCQAVPNGSEYLEYVAQNFRNPQKDRFTLSPTTNTQWPPRFRPCWTFDAKQHIASTNARACRVTPLSTGGADSGS